MKRFDLVKAPRLAGYPGLWAIFAFAFGLVACGSTRDATEKQLKQLREEVTRVQNTSDRLEERMAALELRGVPTPGPEVSEVQPIYRPRLKVIHVAPGDPEQSASSARDSMIEVEVSPPDGRATRESPVNRASAKPEQPSGER